MFKSVVNGKIGVYQLGGTLLGVLYVFGLFTLLSHLSKYGVLSFNLISARVIVAGIFPFISFCGVAIMIYLWYEATKDFSIKQTKAWKNLLIFSAALLYIIYLISQSLAYVFTISFSKLANNSDNGKGAAINRFSGWVLSHFSIQDVVVRTTLDYVLPLIISLIIVAIILGSLILIFLWLGKKKPKREKSSVVKTYNFISRIYDFLNSNVHLYIILDIIFVFFLIYIFCFSINFLFFHDWPLEKVIGNQHMSATLMFSWFVLTTFPLIFFLSTMDLKKMTNVKNIILEIVDKPYPYIAGISGTILLSLLVFGRVIYPTIPYRLGGGELREVKVDFIGDFKEPFSVDARTFLVEETQDSKVFLVSKDSESKVYQVNSANIASLELITK